MQRGICEHIRDDVLQYYDSVEDVLFPLGAPHAPCQINNRVGVCGVVLGQSLQGVRDTLLRQRGARRRCDKARLQFIPSRT